MPDLNREERVGDEVVELQRVAKRHGSDVPPLHPLWVGNGHAFQSTRSARSSSGQLEPPTVVADVLLRPGPRRDDVGLPQRGEDAALGGRDAGARRRHLVKHPAQGWREQLQQRFVRQHQHAVVRGLPDVAEELSGLPGGPVGVSIQGAGDGRPDARQVSLRRQRAAASAIGASRITSASQTSRMLTSCSASARLTPSATAARSGRADHQQLGAALAAQHAGGFQLPDRLTHGGAVNAELPRQFQLGRQPLPAQSVRSVIRASSALATLR